MAIVRVQTQNGGSSATASTLTVTFNSAPTNGNFLVATITSAGSKTVSSITQTGATWVKAKNINNGVRSSEIWYAENISGAAKAVQITYSGNTSSGAAVIAEYSGIVTSSSIDVTASNTGSSTQPDSGTTVATAQAVELWIGSLAQNAISGGGFTSLTNGFVTVGDGQDALPASIVEMDENIVSSIGTANVSGTSVDNTKWAGCIATFKGVASAVVQNAIFMAGD